MSGIHINPFEPMLKRIFLLFIMFSLVFGSVLYSGPVFNYRDATEEEVVLDGEVGKSRLRSSVPLQVLKNNVFINVMVLASFGNLTVEVQKDNGITMYETILNTDTEDQLLIPIADWEAGNYVILFRDTYGGHAEGYMEIKPN